MKSVLHFLGPCIFVTLSSIACSIPSQRKSSSIAYDTVPSFTNSLSFSNQQKKLIEGTWARNVESNASFSVKGDSLYYFEDPAPVFFQIKQDSFIYYLDGRKFFNTILKLDADSLVFIEDGEIMRFYNTER